MTVLLLLAGCDGGCRFCGVDVDFFDTGRRDTGSTAAEVTLDEDGLGATVACPAGDLDVSAVSDGVIRLGEGAGSWAVLPTLDPPDDAQILPYTDAVKLTTGGISALVMAADCHVTVTDATGNVLVDLPAGPGAYALDPSDRIYGLGERTGALVRSGTYTCWNTDAYDAAYGGWAPDADPLYHCIPFWVSLRDGVATGVFVDEPGASTITFDPDAGTTTFASDHAVAQYVIAGPTPAGVLERYTTLTGRAPLPPRWSLGFSQSRWGWADSAAVTDVVDGFRSRDLPLDAVWLDIQHMDGFRSWTWDPDAFPDPAGLVDTLAADGVHAVTIVDPGIKVDPGWPVYDQGVAGGRFLEEDGEPWVGTVWPGDAVFPDFTALATRAWWADLLVDDVDRGVAGFWLDMNEPSEFTSGTVPDTLVADGNGVATTMGAVHNAYALAEAQATYVGLTDAAPDRRPFLLTRAGYAGIQRYAAAWTGDAPSTWDSLAETLPMLLGMAMSGEAWVGSDVGGYSGGASGELYARWMQLGAFSPFFRAHLTEGVDDQYPWSFGTEVLDISRNVLDLRASLVPYLYSLAWSADQTGAPPLRPLVWEWPDDTTAADIGDEAMFGPSLLVAPILVEGATSRDVYLPEGRWFDFTTGVIHDGPATVTLSDLPLAALPIFVREGAIVPRGPELPFTDAAFDPLTLEVWPSTTASTFTVYEDAGDGTDGVHSAVTWTLQGTATGATLSASAREGTYTPDARSLRVRVRRVDNAPTAVRLDGAALSEVATAAAFDAATSGWWWDSVDLSLWIVLPDAAGLTLSMDYDPTITALAPAVAMPFSVTVPDGTPTDTPICIASSADGWVSHTPLTRVGNVATGTLTVPRGEWLYYKYTRGDWSTVEKWPGCAEATNRYALGRAQVKEDTVYDWADGCE